MRASADPEWAGGSSYRNRVDVTDVVRPDLRAAVVRETPTTALRSAADATAAEC